MLYLVKINKLEKNQTAMISLIDDIMEQGKEKLTYN